jgi:hypothetical protein
MEDHQLIDNAFLEDINSLLSAGEVCIVQGICLCFQPPVPSLQCIFCHVGLNVELCHLVVQVPGIYNAQELDPLLTPLKEIFSSAQV